MEEKMGEVWEESKKIPSPLAPPPRREGKKNLPPGPSLKGRGEEALGPGASAKGGGEKAKRGRKRGGQEGNINALKHGLYSRYYTVGEKIDLEENDQLRGNIQQEVTMLRVMMARALKYLQEPTNIDEFLDCLTILSGTAAKVGRLLIVQRQLSKKGLGDGENGVFFTKEEWIQLTGEMANDVLDEIRFENRNNQHTGMPEAGPAHGDQRPEQRDQENKEIGDNDGGGL